jgi:hypothetical protein
MRTNHLHDDDDIGDGNGILRDGERLVVPAYLMDHADDVQRAIAATQAAMTTALDGHRPGYRVADQAALDRSEQAYRERNRRISDAWRSKDRSAADSEHAAELGRDLASGADPRTAAIAARDAWLRNAWRTA